MAKLKFTLSDESINEYGFRVLTEGIDTSDFERNPVMFYTHDRSKLPIGKWSNVTKKSGRLIAEAEFDEEDEFASDVLRKVENGYLNAASIGFDIIELSEEKEVMKKGQTRPTVTKSRLFEASIADLPGNRNALKLNFSKPNLQLKGNIPEDILDRVLPKAQLTDNSNSTDHNQTDMKELNKLLGLKEDATEQERLTAIKNLQKLAKQAEEKETKKKEEETEEVEEQNGKGITKKLTASIISLGKAKGVINDKNEAYYKELAKSNPDTVLGLMESAEAEEGSESESKDGKGKEEHAQAGAVNKMLETLTKGMSAQGKDSADRESWTLTDWRKHDPKGLEKLSKEEPQKFEKLQKDPNRFKTTVKE